jgi:DNA-binding NarL/FixJ family response regulator
MKMIKVMLVDDHAVLRDGLKNIFDFEDDITVIGEADSGENALEKLKQLEPDIIIMDINMPEMNGVEATAQVKQRYPHVKVLMLTMHNEDEYLMAALREGADGYLLKDSPSNQVVEAIRKVAKGESILHPEMTKKLIDYHQLKPQDNDTQLTDREQEVLMCLVEGLSNKDIAKSLFISDKTVKIHVSKIFKKLGVKSRSQAVIFAVQHQLVPLPKTTVES